MSFSILHNLVRFYYPKLNMKKLKTWLAKSAMIDGSNGLRMFMLAYIIGVFSIIVVARSYYFITFLIFMPFTYYFFCLCGRDELTETKGELKKYFNARLKKSNRFDWITVVIFFVLHIIYSFLI